MHELARTRKLINREKLISFSVFLDFMGIPNTIDFKPLKLSWSCGGQHYEAHLQDTINFDGNRFEVINGHS